MTRLRAQIAAVLVLFFLGLFAGQLRHVLDTVRGDVEAGARITDELRSTVTTLGATVDAGAGQLRAQIENLQAQVTSGTASPEQVRRLEGLLRARTPASPVQGPPGPPGPQGPIGPSPGPPATTTTTGPVITTTSRPPVATTTTSGPRPSTTTTTRCTIGIGRLLKAGCT